MKKIKLLFDMEVLSTTYSSKKGTGIYRVTEMIFSRFANSPLIDLFPLVTLKAGDVKGYLDYSGFDNLKDKLVYLPKLKSTTQYSSFYKRIRSKVLSWIISYRYMSIISKFDAYFSPANSISPIIKNLKTFSIIYDLIPIFCPLGCSKNLINEHKRSMNRLSSDVIFSISDYTTKDIIKFNPKLKNRIIEKIYLAADEKFRQIENKANIEQSKTKYNIKIDKYFLGVSELNPRKNFVHLLKSFIKFLDDTKANDIYLVLVGPVRKGYEDIAKQVANLDKYKDKIIQTGYVDDDDLAPLYNGALAFIYPSLYEGFGLPVLEAMQCGTPVISADNTSLPEVGGDAVLYISGRDEEQTAEALAKVYKDQDLRAKLSNKGLARAKEFNWDKTIEILLNTIFKQCNKDN